MKKIKRLFSRGKKGRTQDGEQQQGQSTLTQTQSMVTLHITRPETPPPLPPLPPRTRSPEPMLPASSVQAPASTTPATENPTRSALKPAKSLPAIRTDLTVPAVNIIPATPLTPQRASTTPLATKGQGGLDAPGPSREARSIEGDKSRKQKQASPKQPLYLPSFGGRGVVVQPASAMPRNEPGTSEGSGHPRDRTPSGSASTSRSASQTSLAGPSNLTAAQKFIESVKAREKMHEDLAKESRSPATASSSRSQANLPSAASRSQTNLSTRELASRSQVSLSQGRRPMLPFGGPNKSTASLAASSSSKGAAKPGRSTPSSQKKPGKDTGEPSV